MRPHSLAEEGGVRSASDGQIEEGVLEQRPRAADGKGLTKGQGTWNSGLTNRA